MTHPLASPQHAPLGIQLGARTSNNKPPKQNIPAETYEKILKYWRTKENTTDLSGILTKYLFNPNDWKHYYYEHQWKEYSNVRRALRKTVQMGTLQALLRGKYFIEDNNTGSEPVVESDEKVQIVSEKQPTSSKKNEEEIIIEEEPRKQPKINQVELDEVNTAQPKKNKKKKDRKNKKKQMEESDDETAGDSTFDGFDIQREEDKEPLFELNEWKDDKKQKKKNAKKPQKKKNQKEEQEEEVAEEDGLLNEDNFKEEEGIPVKPIHIDFNAIKKACKSTERIDCIEFPSVVSITKSSATTSKQHEKTEVDESENPKTWIQVVNTDCLEAAILLKKVKKLNPLLLVSASQTSPGGAYTSGANSQEEDMCRRTGLALCLADPYNFHDTRESEWAYPIPEFGGIYVPNIIAIRKPKTEGYAFMDKPTPISMFAMYPYADPPLEKRKVATSSTEEVEEDTAYEYFLSTKLANSMKKKIASLFEVALRKGHDSLVITPIGCGGAHSNPAYHIALLFKEVLSSEIFKDKFKAVIFAILNDNETDSKLANEESEEIEECDEPEAAVVEDLDTSLSKRNNVAIFSKVFHEKEEAPKLEDCLN